MDLQKEREAFEDWHYEQYLLENPNIDISNAKYIYDYAHKNALVCQLKESHFTAWQAAKAQVKEVAQRQGGYYIRDLRNQSGNCMKFWYKAGYGTKHKNFFWCATLEEAKKYMGDCGWFEIWHAPYIDSLVEYTVDFQLADRNVGLVDLKAQA